MEFDLRQYLRLALKWWWLLAIGAIIPAIVSYYFISQQLPLYEARVVLMVGSTLQSTDPDTRDFGVAQRLAQGYAEMVSYRPVTSEVIRKMGLQRSPEKLASQIVAVVRPEANLLEIHVTDSNPRAAALIANALADELIRQGPGSQIQDEQQRFIEQQLNELKTKVERIEQDIEKKRAELATLTSASDILMAQQEITDMESLANSYRTGHGQYLQAYTGGSASQLSIVEPAVEPRLPIDNRQALILAVSGAAGLALALGAALIIEYLDDTVRWDGNRDQKLAGMPVLGSMARMPNSKGAIIARSTERSPEAEAIRTLRTNLFLSRRRAPYRSILITSSSSREGKSFVTANLAVSLAASGLRTVLVDGDMRRPTQHAIFDLPNFFGLADLLHRNISAEEVASVRGLQATEIPNLHLLSAGKIPLDPAILLTSPNLSLLMRALQERADIILVDSPPVLSAPDTALLASECGATLLVVNNGVTTRTEINKSKTELLQHEGINLTGVAFNNVKLRGGSHYYYGTSRRSLLLDKVWPSLPIFGTHDSGANGRPSDDPDRILDLKGMAAYLGIQPRMAKRWCQSGRIPAFKKRRRWYVRHGDLQTMVFRHLSGETDDREVVAMFEPDLPRLENRN